MASAAPRVVIFGGQGFIGGHLQRVALAAGVDTHVAGRDPGRATAGQFRAVDIKDAFRVRQLIDAIRPTAVVNLAGVSEIDRAEREPALARAINVEAARGIARAAHEVGAYLVYFSTDAVFSGREPSYREDDPHGPVNEYGRSKSAGEAVVQEACAGAGIVRISLTLGFPVNAAQSFCATVAAAAERRATIVAPRDEVRTPSDADTLARCVLELIALRHAGAVHVGGLQSVSRAELAATVARLAGYPDAVIDESPASGRPGRAPRHLNGVLDVSLARRLLRTPLLPLDASLAKAFADRRVPGR